MQNLIQQYIEEINLGDVQSHRKDQALRYHQSLLCRFVRYPRRCLRFYKLGVLWQFQIPVPVYEYVSLQRWLHLSISPKNGNHRTRGLSICELEFEQRPVFGKIHPDISTQRRVLYPGRAIQISGGQHDHKSKFHLRHPVPALLFLQIQQSGTSQCAQSIQGSG